MGPRAGVDSHRQSRPPTHPPPTGGRSVASRYTHYVITAQVLVQSQAINHCRFTVIFVGQHKYFVVKIFFHLQIESKMR